MTLASLLPDSPGGWIALVVGLIGLAAAVQQLTAAFFRRRYLFVKWVKDENARERRRRQERDAKIASEVNAAQ